MNRLGDQCRKRVGKAFRKKLGMFNYKVKEYGIKKIRSPGSVPLDVKLRYMKVFIIQEERRPSLYDEA
jgi:hypothetical protein